jgi:tRNA-Thr(GGU) m(6)t(6)A37 methyltransferase TsaA
VQNRFNTPPEKSERIRREKSKIILFPKYAEGLYRIGEHKYLEVIFHFNRSKGYSLECKTPHWGVKGVFASRSPHRPVPLGLTRVRLIDVNKNELVVKGLDALNGTPVLDIKPYVNFLELKKEIHRHGKQKRAKKGNQGIIGKRRIRKVTR